MTVEEKFCGRKTGRTTDSDAIWHATDGVTDHAPRVVSDMCQ